MSTITALLGPTNTGKTHRAVTQLLSHRTGVIGLPLRLLAREVYDRLTAEVGEAAVALVTGEEKRVPARPRYWVCTVESMPEGKDVEFLAVDEIQLAGHRERGHVFTDRLMRARGVSETMFLGSDTMTAAVEALVPTARIERHPRFSRLRGVAPLELTQLPPRSAVVAFSADQVYALAEQLRRRRGGAAVVLGALSPRTRNAQVAMYQAGEVDYIVATDAIGMGLNMDVDHVAFAALGKFDGRANRPLEAAELAQIAGRAGRYTKDGTFGPLATLGPLPQGLVISIERHQFPPVERLVWRSPDLDFTSIEALARSLRQRPPRPGLQLLERSDDEEVLVELAGMSEVRALAQQSGAVELLWEVCRIPDFRKLLEGSHARLLAAVYLQLAKNGRLDPGWIERRVRRLDDTEGDIEALMSRIAAVRTWTYISHRPGWIEAPARWQEWTRAIEDRLSDALHDRLTQAFVDPRATARARKKPVPKDSPFGRLRALQLPDADEPAPPSAAEAIVAAPHGAFAVDARGRVSLAGRPAAQMTRGPDLLRPEVQVLADMSMGAGSIAQVRRRMVAWTRDLVAELLAPLRALPEGPPPSPAARGLLYQLEQGLGSVLRARAEPQVRHLTGDDRRLLGRLGLKIGELVVFSPELLTTWSVERRAALWAARSGSRVTPPGEARSIALTDDADPAAFHAIGFPPFGPRAIRADIAERVFNRVVAATRAGPAALPEELAAWIGCAADEVPAIVAAMGFDEVAEDRWLLAPRRPERRGRRRTRRAG
ncbi:helicase-related protein [Nannocystis sp. RBIL2]|uniref:helicase-related protein n=1 Tax=Nannocystis sp. RBIL2 TaxID=2996788 RepID=UPI00226E7A9C|nr:helicase-related protein [Nannocystis sp. RBIL2]MCY1070824.1 helicase-related protein [Nannocystis sp. RBIL2]